MNPQSAEIRQFLTTAFNDEELTTLCFDHFRVVHDNFATGMTKGQKIQLLIDHCLRRDVLPRLLSVLSVERPQQFANWDSQLTASAGSRTAIGDAVGVSAPTAQVSGGVNLSSDDTAIGGDVVGRDKIESAGGHIIHAGNGATVIIGAQSPALLSRAVRLQQAERLLETRSYREAEQLLSDIVREDPREPQARLLCALALLRGRNPETVSRPEMAQIESHLNAARSQPETRSLAALALAVVKHDFYVANGMDEGSPSLKQLLDEVRTLSIAVSEQPLLQHIRATRAAKRLINLDW